MGILILGRNDMTKEQSTILGVDTEKLKQILKGLGLIGIGLIGLSWLL